MKLAPHTKKGLSVKRNEPCPCGSGKKNKKCCLSKGITWRGWKSETGEVEWAPIASEQIAQIDSAPKD